MSSPARAKLYVRIVRIFRTRWLGVFILSARLDAQSPMPRYYTRFRLHARTHAIGLQLLGALSDLVVGSPLYFMPTRRLGPYAGARRPPANDNKSLHQSRGVCDMSVHKHMSKHTHTHCYGHKYCAHSTSHYTCPCAIWFIDTNPHGFR